MHLSFAGSTTTGIIRACAVKAGASKHTPVRVAFASWARRMNFECLDPPSVEQDFWEDAYLTQRSSIAINTNPFFTLEDDPTPARTSQIARATTLAWSSLLFCQSVRSGKVEPDVQRTTPLCMCQVPQHCSTAAPQHREQRSAIAQLAQGTLFALPRRDRKPAIAVGVQQSLRGRISRARVLLGASSWALLHQCCRFSVPEARGGKGVGSTRAHAICSRMHAPTVKDSARWRAHVHVP